MSGPGLLYAALACYAFAAVAVAIVRSQHRTGRLSRASIAVSSLGIALQLAFTVARTVSVGFLPFASRFEAMALFALAVQAAGLAVYLATRQHSAKLGTDALSAVLLLGALVSSGFHPGGGLNPILNSPWFAVHIVAAFAGYGCFSAGLAWSVSRLFDRALDLNPTATRRLALAGLVLLGAGILTGAMWADSSWGTYWNWDPKESWALLTWTVMMLFVHLGGRRPSRAAAGVFFGLAFALMLFTFFGINLLKWGLHRYQ
ncbi:cytochrome c biogenesis protein CcsA [candidate division WOR-3 bacterium]|nr:cytochrome c biogenesis protein CcsA [candidate division WOR-3 bacterium]